MFIFHLFIACLPYLCLLGTIWLFRLKDCDGPLFSSVARGSLAWSLVVWLQANILSWLDLIDGTIIAVFWLLYFAALCPFLYKLKSSWRLGAIRGWNWIFAIILFFTLVAAIAYPPNNYDVLTYHMPRVAHWTQNRTMAPYPTSVDRQIGMAPFNAMIALQSYAPFRLDYFVNLGQWLAFAGCLLAVNHITALLGGGRFARFFALLFAATLPSAIIQASNTECSLIVSFFLCVMAIEYLYWRKENYTGWKRMISFGVALGLAILSKGSAYPIALPFVCLVGWQCLWHPKRAFIQGLAAALIIIGINLPHFARTMEYNGSMVASAEKNIVSHPTPATLAMNSLYNFLSNHPPLLRGERLAFWEKVTAALGIDQNDRSILPWGGLSGHVPVYRPDDSDAPAILQSLFLFFLLFAIIFHQFRPPWLYFSTVGASFFFFCLLLTWHPWIARIQISLFILMAPVCGLCLDAFKNRIVRFFTPALFCFCAIWPLLLCMERPIAPPSCVESYVLGVRHFLTSPREMLVFNQTPANAIPYMQGVDFLAGCNPDSVGINVGDNGWEYPLWLLLNNRMEKMPYIEHMVEGKKAEPDFIFVFTRQGNTEQSSPRIMGNISGKQKQLFPPVSFRYSSSAKIN